MKSEISNSKKYILIAAVFVLIAVLAVFTASAARALSSKKIYDGISVGGEDIGGLSRDEAKTVIENYFKKYSDFSLSFECGGVEFDVPTADISLKAKAADAAKAAYDIGRGHGFFKNYMDIISLRHDGYSVPLEISYDKERLVVLVTDQISDKTKDPTPVNVEVGTDRLYVTNATAGEGIDTKKLFKETDKRLKKLSPESPIVLKIETLEAKKIDADEFIKKYTRDAKDAVYTKTDGGFVIEPEVVGISFDADEAKKIINANKNNDKTYEIPAKITYPAVTAKMLEDKYVNKIIASYTTSFAGSSANRIANIALAAKKIDGYVINPGKRFSYNGVVGPRTAAAGFKMAHVYVGNQVTDGIGGGICQVSSTLYNAALLSDMKIVSRTNHSMPVGYVPLGRDATVSYGSIDFVFENDKPYPVSVKASVSGTNVTVSIVGSKTEDYTVAIVTDGAKAVPYSTVKVEDSTLPEGQIKVITKGVNGSVVNSYRVYKKNGTEYSRKYEAKSTYSPTAEKIAVGTKKVQTPTPQPPAAEPENPPAEETPDIGTTEPTPPQTEQPQQPQQPTTEESGTQAEESADDPLDM